MHATHAARAALLGLLWTCAAPAWSHDSWLAVERPAAGAAGTTLELATGNRFPIQEVAPAPGNVARSGCSDGRGTVPLAAPRQGERALGMQPATAGGRSPLACWVELGALDIELEPRLVQVYFDEIRAPQSVRTAWARMRERGVRWQERYRKFARIELAGEAADAAGRAAARRPVGLDLEIVLLGSAPVRLGEPLAFQVLRDGQPLAGFPVELVSDRSPVGVWRTTDAQGRVQHRLPFAGQWLLRGTDLRLSATRRDAWESRFVTLVVEVPGGD